MIKSKISASVSKIQVCILNTLIKSAYDAKR